MIYIGIFLILLATNMTVPKFNNKLERILALSIFDALFISGLILVVKAMKGF